MSLRQQAAQIQQDAAQQQRTAQTAHDAQVVQVLERKLSLYTGVPAIHQGIRTIAHEGYARGNSWDRSSTRIVEHADMHVLLVDDVLVGAKRSKNEYAYGNPETYKWDWCFVFEDPQRGSYKKDNDSLNFYAAERGDGTPTERTESFVKMVAGAGHPKHPAVKLTEAGERCPTCHRGYGNYDEDRY